MIYLPYEWISSTPLQAEKLTFIKSVCSFEREQLTAGYLFRITDWLI